MKSEIGTQAIDEAKTDWKKKGVKEKYERICEMESVFDATKGKYPTFAEFKKICEDGRIMGDFNTWVSIGGCRGADTRSYRFHSNEEIKETKDKEDKEHVLDKIKREAADAPLKLTPLGNDLYKLSQKIGSSEWSRVSKYFTYYYGDSGKSEDCIIEEYNIRGWGTRDVKKVEEILDIPLEQTVEYRDKEKKKQEEGWAKEKAIERAERRKLFDYIDKQFENAETPDPEVKQPGFITTELRDYKLIEVDGIEIRDPRYDGFGKKWIIQKKWIWKIKNTEHDGYGNNVLTFASTRGIGVRVPYTKKLAGTIIGLTSREFTTKKELGEIEEIYGSDFEEIWEE